jgi:hypothetical protein
MRFSKLLTAVIASVVAVASVLASAAPVVVFGNLGGSGTNDLAASTNAGISDTTWLAHGFTVGGTNTFLDKVTLGLADNDSTTARVQLFASVGTGTDAQPSGAALATRTATVSSNTPTLQSFDFNQFALTPGSSYWLVVSSPDLGSLFNWVFNNDGDFPTSQNASGWSPLSPVTKLSTDSGSSWNSSGSNRPASISITAVPEPGSIALAGIGIAAAGLRLRRRSRRQGDGR